MSETKFTKGPWEVTPTGYRVMSATRGTVWGQYICDTANNAKTRTPENAANAHLISAAPEMYEALNEARLWFEDNGRGENETCKQIRAALAKARGEQ